MAGGYLKWLAITREYINFVPLEFHFMGMDTMKTWHIGILGFLFLGMMSFFLPTAEADFIPELRAYKLNSSDWDDVIRSEWSYLEGVNFTTNTITYSVLPPTFKNSGQESGGIISTTHFTLTSGQVHTGGGSDSRGGGEISNFFDHYTLGITRDLTLKGLEVGEFYTLQIFSSSSEWRNINGAIRPTNFTFFDTYTQTAQPFRVFNGDNPTPTAYHKIRIEEENITGTFPNIGITDPLSIEYTFQATAGTMRLNLESLDGGNNWQLYGVALAAHGAVNPYGGNTYENSGSLSNQGGKLCVEASTLFNGTEMPTTNWKIEVATSLDGPRLMLGEGIVSPGEKQAVQGNLFVVWGMDPGFELSGAGASGYWMPDFIRLGTEPSGSFFNNERTGDSNGVHGGDWKGVPSGCGFSDGQQDRDYGYRILRSLPFELTGEAISFWLQGGNGTLSFPLSKGEPAEGRDNGFLGVALRLENAPDGEYLPDLAKRRSGSGADWQQLSFSAAELAAYIGQTVTLDIIDDAWGGWGWIAADDFSMIGEIPFDDSLFYFLSVGETADVHILGPGLQEDATTPEPATWGLMALGLAAVAVWGRSRRK